MGPAGGEGRHKERRHHPKETSDGIRQMSTMPERGTKVWLLPEQDKISAVIPFAGSA